MVKKILIVKMSSMGDVLHTLPALTDASRSLGEDVIFDWLVEEQFAEIPTWHPAVRKVIPVALRRWRKQGWWRSLFSKEWRAFKKQLRKEQYDIILDAQGLWKSAWMSWLARGYKRMGLSWRSARESWASLFYQRRYFVELKQHAVVRVRQLFAQALGYRVPEHDIDYGLERQYFVTEVNDLPLRYVICFVGTTWPTKHYPEAYWRELIALITQTGMHVVLTWGNAAEHTKVTRLASQSELVYILPKSSLSTVASVLTKAQACVSVDTGLSHLAAALAVPALGLYGPTDPKRTGAMGAKQLHLAAEFPCAPCLQRQCTYTGSYQQWPGCFDTLPPNLVYQKLTMLLANVS